MDSQAPRKPEEAKTSEKQQKAKKNKRIALNDTNRKDTPRPGPKVKSVFKKPTSSHVSMCTAPVAPTEYWKEISEQRRLALKEALDENKKLYGELDVLKDECSRLRDVANQAEYFSMMYACARKVNEERDAEVESRACSSCGKKPKLRF